MERVKAFAPATVANMGVGFDVLGMAVEGIGDYVTVEKTDKPGIEMVDIVGDAGRLSRDPKKNTAMIAAQSVLNMLDIRQGVRLWLEKGLPLASGMGSSAASAVAAAVATNTLFGEPLGREDLLPAVLDAEEIVSGRHADNVAPALLGGIVLITGLSAAEIHRLPVPAGLHISLVTPGVEVPTAAARAVLPQLVPLSVMVHQTGVIAELIHGLHRGDIHLMAMAMQRDAIVEPARESLIPYLAQMRLLATECGALVTIISGSGPTVCSICASHEDAEVVNQAIREAYHQNGLSSTGYVTVPSIRGAYIVEPAASA